MVQKVLMLLLYYFVIVRW